MTILQLILKAQEARGTNWHGRATHGDITCAVSKGITGRIRTTFYYGDRVIPRVKAETYFPK